MALVHPVCQTLADLVRIHSVNPAYDGGGSEAGVAEYVEAFCRRHGLTTWTQEVLPGRHNVVAEWPGRNPARRIVLEAHMDTVSVKGMTIDPFDPVIRDGRLYGRGSCDTKAGLAAMMHVLASLREEGITPECTVCLAAVVDEEHAFRGVTRFCQGLVAEAAIVAEPTELKAVVASKGTVRWRILVRGKAAHSSKPHLGINAINHMARIVLALEADHARLAGAPHPLLGPGTCNVGVIQGGVQINFVPDTCVIEIDRRLIPGEDADAVLRGYQQILDGLKREHPTMDAVMEPPILRDWPLDTATDSVPARWAQTLLQRMGLDPALTGVPFCSDASKFTRAGIPSLIFGPGSIDRAHAAVEFVEVDQVLRALEFYREFVIGYR